MWLGLGSSICLKDPSIIGTSYAPCSSGTFRICMSICLQLKPRRSYKKKHDESLRDYVKYFSNTRNVILYIQDIRIINAFCDGVSDIKIVEEIAMKKSKMVVDLLVVADVCIEASEAQARLLESHGKGPRRKSRMIGRSTQPIMEITGIARITEIEDITRNTSSNPQIRRRRDCSITLLMQRSGRRSIILQDMI
jgi:hypothetical protein